MDQPSDIAVNTPHYNPIRDLDKVKEELLARGAPFTEVALDENYVPIKNYKKADMHQVIKDWTRELKVQMYINGEPLAVILRKIQVETLRKSLLGFLNDVDHKEINEKAFTAFFPNYQRNQPLNDISNESLEHFIDNFPNNKEQFTNLAKAHPGGEDLIDIFDADITKFFHKEASTAANESVWYNIVNNYLLKNEPKEHQQEFVKFLVGYAHQGGFLFPTTTALTQIVTDANKYSRTDFTISNDALHSQATIELSMVNGELVIREKTAIDKIFHFNEDADLENDYIMEERNEDNKPYNIIEFDVTQIAKIDPMLLEDKNNNDIKVKIGVEDATARSYKDGAWEFVANKLTVSQRSAEMVPRLIQYADLYKLKRHDSRVAQAIFNDFPEISEISPIKTLKSIDKLFSQRVQHNTEDSILALLGRLKPDYGNDIVKHFPDYLAEGQVAFTNAMKLLHRLGHSDSLIRLLSSYMPDVKDTHQLTAEVRPETYVKIVEQFATAKINDFEKNGKDIDDFVQAMETFAKTNKSKYLKLVQSHLPDASSAELMSKSGMEKLHANFSAELLHSKLNAAHHLIANFRDAPPTREKFIETMEALQKIDPKELSVILAPYKLIHTNTSGEKISYNDLRKAYAGFVQLNDPDAPPPLPPRPSMKR